MPLRHPGDWEMPLGMQKLMVSGTHETGLVGIQFLGQTNHMRLPLRFPAQFLPSCGSTQHLCHFFGVISFAEAKCDRRCLMATKHCRLHLPAFQLPSERQVLGPEDSTESKR